MFQPVQSNLSVQLGALSNVRGLRNFKSKQTLSLEQRDSNILTVDSSVIVIIQAQSTKNI